MKKTFALLLALSLTFTLVLCGGTGALAASGKPVAIRLGIAQADDNPYTQGAKKFAEEVNKRSNGRIVVSVFANGQLGQERDMTEGVSLGSLEMCLVSNAPLTNFSARFRLFELPYLFMSYEHAEKVCDGEIGKALLKDLEAINIVGLAYFENGFRNLTNSNKTINSPADLAGMKIRVMESDVHIATWKVLGANPTPMAWGEVYTALQQKTIDGQENPTVAIYDQKIYEVNKFLSVTEHVYTPVELIINKKVFYALSPEDQQLVRDCAQEAAVFERQIARAVNNKLKDLEKEGVKITYVDKAPFQTLCKPIYEKFGAQIPDLIKGVQALQ